MGGGFSLADVFAADASGFSDPFATLFLAPYDPDAEELQDMRYTLLDLVSDQLTFIRFSSYIIIYWMINDLIF